ncbi:ABC transporter substrate-binding protein, partial [Methanocalculus sp.]|uniref:ABC transporter substrate-binding protein n=1 Tax=Methanocalculus sp. TaxID=2004547 RepID=UPI0027157F56
STALLLLLICSVLIAPASALPDMNHDELGEAILPYMRSTYLGDDLIHYAASELQVAACRVLGFPEPPENTNVLKIATSNVILDTKFYSDYYIGIFAKVSNMPLMKMESSGLISGLTAERYEVSGDNTEWTFYLRDNLFWSDGRRVKPEDVVFTFEYLGEHEPNAGWIKETLLSTRISEEDNSVTFVWNKPYTTINLEFNTYNLIPKHIWEEIDSPTTYDSPGPFVAHGPYYIEDVDLNAAILTFKKNPHWKGQQPYFGTVEIHWYANDNAAALALESGVVDSYYKYANSYPYANVQRLVNTGNFNILQRQSIGLTFLAPNLKRAPMDDLQFREALAKAINYQELITTETLGYGTVPNRGFVPPGMDHYKATPQLTYNPANARQILADAGYKDINGDGFVEGKNGETINLELVVRGGYERIGPLLKEYLEAVGIKVTVTQVDTATWVSRKDNYNYDLTATAATPWGMLMHAGWGTGYFDSRRTGQGVLHNLDDPTYLQLCDDILSTTDRNQMKIYAEEVQDYFNENLPAIALYWKQDVIPYNKKYTGWYYQPLFGIYTHETFLNVRPV